MSVAGSRFKQFPARAGTIDHAGPVAAVDRERDLAGVRRPFLRLLTGRRGRHDGR